MGAAPVGTMTSDDFLAWEREQLEKHEYVRGEVFAMAATSPRHNGLGASVMARLASAFDSRAFTALSSHQRLSLPPGPHYAYADGVVVCGPFEAAPGTKDVLANPSVVVEVLSPTTEAYDRGEKWAAYRAIPSLTDYLLVSQSTVSVEHFQRSSEGGWRYFAYGPGETVTLTGGVVLSIDELFNGAFELPGAE